MDSKAFFKIAYGLYVITSRDGANDNGMICNTVVQVTATPERLAVTINKSNHSHDVIKATGLMNVCALAESAPFAVFERFGFKSGRDTDKFAGFDFGRGANGLAIPAKDVSAVFELKVEDYIDLGTHGMFICAVTEASVTSDAATMTYSYYHANVKPKPHVLAKDAKPQAPGKQKWVCKICGYVYDPAENGGVAFEDLPADWQCPWCKHPKADFEPVG